MERHHKRSKTRQVLNMVSLMDIFTILVFFLLVSAADTEVLSSPKTIKLPESTAESQPKQNIIITVNDKIIMVQGKPVVDARKALTDKTPVISPLLQALNAQAQHHGRDKADKVRKRGVTIMGDKEIPYRLLKKIMLTCAHSEFTNISLAVVQKAPEKS
jgi:biopolymer transport protein ExbD